MKTFPFIAHHEKQKTWGIVLNCTAHIEEIGGLEGKKSLFEEILVFSKEIWPWSDRLQRTRQLSFRFSSTSFTSTVK